MPQHHNFDSSPAVSLKSPAQANQNSKEDRLLNLLDKYVKVNNNLLPLLAYLKYLEGEDHWQAFASICDTSPSENAERPSDAEKASAASHAVALNRQANSTSSLSLQRATVQPRGDEDRPAKERCDSVLLAQKYHKLIVSIDYAPQTTSLRFVEKSLQQLFIKLAAEYNELHAKHPQASREDPKIYLTVLLWNRTFTSPTNAPPSRPSGIEHPTFIIIFHSKLVTRSNLSSMAKIVLDKINEAKSTLLEAFNTEKSVKLSVSEMVDNSFNPYFVPNVPQQHQHQHHHHHHHSQSPFESLLSTVVKLFNHFDLNNDESYPQFGLSGPNSILSPQLPAASSMVSCHHVYITDGLLYTTDLTKFLEKVGTSGINFSFICTSSSKGQSGSNISCGFGNAPDHYIMDFLTRITNGFFAVIDENLDCSFLQNTSILEYFVISSTSASSPETGKSEDASKRQTERETGSSTSGQVVITGESNDDHDEDHEMETNDERNPESRDHFDSTAEKQKIEKINRLASKNKRKMSDRSSRSSSFNRLRRRSADTSLSAEIQAQGFMREQRSEQEPERPLQSSHHLRVSTAYNYDQHVETKCLVKYDLPMLKFQSLEQYIRYRSLEGFFLVKVTRQLVKLPESTHDTVSSPNRRGSISSKQQPASGAQSSSDLVLITLYFKRYFNQTISFLYKLSYYAKSTAHGSQPGPCPNSEADEPAKMDDVGLGNLTSTPRTLAMAQQQQSQQPKLETPVAGKHFVEIWLTWSFLHLKSKHQNSVLGQVKRFLERVYSIDNDVTNLSLYELTPIMLNPPEILKLKEPLFKTILDLNVHASKVSPTDHYYDYGEMGGGPMASSSRRFFSNNVFSVNNTNYELNMRTKSTEMEKVFVEFAHSWLHLAFLNPSSSSTQSIVSTGSSSAFQQAGQNFAKLNYHNSSLLNRYFSTHKIRLILEYDRPLPDVNSIIFDINRTAAMLHQFEFDLMGGQNSGYGPAGHVNYGYDVGYDAGASSRFNGQPRSFSQSSYMGGGGGGGVGSVGDYNYDQYGLASHANLYKYNIYNCNNSYNKLCTLLAGWCDVMLVENSVYLKYLTLNKHSSAHALASSSLSEETAEKGDAKRDDTDSAKASNKGVKAQQHHHFYTKPFTSSESSSSSSSAASAGPVNSYVILRIDSQHIPYVSIELLFHSAATYYERMKVIGSLKESLFELSFNNPSAQPSSEPSASGNAATAASTTSSNAATASNTTGGAAQSNASNYNCCHLLFKPDLFDTVKKMIFNEAKIGLSDPGDAFKHRPTSSSIHPINPTHRMTGHGPGMRMPTPGLSSAEARLLSGSQLLGKAKRSSTILFENLMQQKRIKWTISKLFSLKKSLTLKEQIIDTFVRVRLREGFKCLFQCSKFAVFTIQLNMVDSGSPQLDSSSSNGGSCKAGSEKSSEVSSLNSSGYFTQSQFTSFSGSSEQVQNIASNQTDSEKFGKLREQSSQLLSSSFSEFTSVNKNNFLRSSSKKKSLEDAKSPTRFADSNQVSSQYCTVVYVVNFMNSNSISRTSSQKMQQVAPNNSGSSLAAKSSKEDETHQSSASKLLKSSNQQGNPSGGNQGLLNIAKQQQGGSLTSMGGQTPSSTSSLSNMSQGQAGKDDAGSKSSRPANTLAKADSEANENLDSQNSKQEDSDIMTDLNEVYNENPELYFTTEMYVEPIGGVYYDPKLNVIVAKSSGSVSANSAVNQPGDAKTETAALDPTKTPIKPTIETKDSASQLNLASSLCHGNAYFQSLNYQQILNLIYLNDLRSFLTLQSSHAFYIDLKNKASLNSYSNSTPLRVLQSLMSEGLQPQAAATASLNSYCHRGLFSSLNANQVTLSALKKSLGNHVSFAESMRLLPELCVILPKPFYDHLVQAIKEPFYQSPTSAYKSTIGVNKRNASSPRINMAMMSGSGALKDGETTPQSTLVTSSSSANLVNRIRLPNKSAAGQTVETIAGSIDSTKGAVEMSTPSLADKLSTSSGSRIPDLSASVDTSRQALEAAKKQTAGGKKSKKSATFSHEHVSLNDQLKPILDFIEKMQQHISSTHHQLQKQAFLGGTPFADVDFKFSLRDLLLESPLFMCIYEDVPFKSFAFAEPDTDNSASMEQIKKLFFSNVAEHINKVDSSGSSGGGGGGSSTRKTYDFVVNSMRNDLIKVLSLKLNDIKISGSSDYNFIRHLIDHLNGLLLPSRVEPGETTKQGQQEQQDSFKCYLKFNTEAQMAVPNPGGQNASHLNKNLSANQLLTRHDCLENKFFVYGLFFLNKSSSHSKISQQSVQNKLVFFMFNCEPENVKYSLINSHANTYLIRKYLFPMSMSPSANPPLTTQTSVSSEQPPSQQQQQQSKQQPQRHQKRKNSNISGDWSYRFYFSKNSVVPNQQPAQQQAANAASGSKKYYTISEILKLNLPDLKHAFSLSSSNAATAAPAGVMGSAELAAAAKYSSAGGVHESDYLLSYVNYIEECCAKSFISSLIRFIGLRAVERSVPSTRALDLASISSPTSPSPTNKLCRLSSSSSYSKGDDGTGVICKELAASLNFEIDSITQLLNIARKVKLIDLDLTNYLRINCKHINGQQSNAAANVTVTNNASAENQEESDQSSPSICAETDKLAFDWTKCHSSKLGKTRESSSGSLNPSLMNSTDELNRPLVFNANTNGASASSSTSVEKRFNEIFLNRFNQLPGYKNLFIFTPCQTKASGKASDAATADAFNSKDYFLHFDDAAGFLENHSDSESARWSDSDNSDLDFELTEMEMEIKELVDHHFHHHHHNLNGEERMTLASAKEEYDDIDAIESIEDEDEVNAGANERLLTGAGKSNVGADLKGPFSKHMASFKRPRIRRTTHRTSYKSETLSRQSSVNYEGRMLPVESESSIGEQIIGLEFVCVIGGLPAPANAKASLIQAAGPGNPRKPSRTRTTTLTSRDNLDDPASNSYLEYPDSANGSSLNPVSFTGTALTADAAAMPAGQVHQTHNLLSVAAAKYQQQQQQQSQQQFARSAYQKWKFFAKFQKFNFSCLLDLIDSCDSFEVTSGGLNPETLKVSDHRETFEEFRSLISRLEMNETVDGKKDAGLKHDSLTLDDVKIYLRFNWYSFDEFYSANNEAHESSTAGLNKLSTLRNSGSNVVVQPQLFSSASVASSVHDRRLLTPSSKITPQFQTQLSLGSKAASNSNLFGASLGSRVSNSLPHFHSGGGVGNEQKFEYFHLLNPSLKEFKWYLKDYIQQMDAEQSLDDAEAFVSYMKHIKKGAKRNNEHCKTLKKKVLLNKKITTKKQVPVETKPFTNANKLMNAAAAVASNASQYMSGGNISGPLTRTQTIVEQDKSIINVDEGKFFAEFILMIKNNLGQPDFYHNCSLKVINNNMYYVNCALDLNELNKLIDEDADEDDDDDDSDADNYSTAADDVKRSKYYSAATAAAGEAELENAKFKILIKLKEEKEPKKKPGQPSRLDRQFSDVGEISVITSTTSPYKHGPTGAAGLEPKLMNAGAGGGGGRGGADQFRLNQVQRKHLHMTPSNEPEQTVETSSLRIKYYFSFNKIQTDVFSNSVIRMLTRQFTQKLDELINAVYLRLLLKDIHDSRKWNNLLMLRSNNSSNLIRSNSFRMSSKDMDDETDLQGSKSEMSHNLVCNCVWSDYFRLHRLHQTTLKSHLNVASSALDSSLSLSQQAQQQLQGNQQQISQGLKKLQESLVNFKIEDYAPPLGSNSTSSSSATAATTAATFGGSGDLYVYTIGTEIYLLKLEECSAVDIVSNVGHLGANKTGAQADMMAGTLDNMAMSNKTISILSRRSSCASITPSSAANAGANNLSIVLETKMAPGVSASTLNRSTSHTGSSTSTTAAAIISSKQTQTVANAATSAGLQPGSTGFNTSSLTSQQNAAGSTSQSNQALHQRSSIEFIRLSVYGMQEPGEEIKKLVASLQSELDYWLLQRMCTSIEKNTYKTTSAQHPDRITDEDLTFFKNQICDMNFDYEIEMPFLLNFNRTMRENFFYFLKHIFNANFKSIDAPMPIPMPRPMPSIYNQASDSSRVVSVKPSSIEADDVSKNLGNEFDQPEPYSEAGAEASARDDLSESGANADQSEPESTTTTAAKTASTKKQIKYSTSHASTLKSEGQRIKATSHSFQSTKPNLIVNNLESSASMLMMNHDPYMIHLSRILFHNSKNIRIGKHSVSLILVEAFYSIKGKDALVLAAHSRLSQLEARAAPPGTTSKVHRSNSLSVASGLQQTELKKEQQVIGPTFLFRFFCRAANENEINLYKANLKSALNEALLLFVSEYVTRIEPEAYLKTIEFTKTPPEFRNNRAMRNKSISSLASASSSLSTTTLNATQTGKKPRFKVHSGDAAPNHQSTSASVSSSTVSVQSCSFASLLQMNRKALATKLGEQLGSQQILLSPNSPSSSLLHLYNTSGGVESGLEEPYSPSDFPSRQSSAGAVGQDLFIFIMNNLKNNLFDQRDYQDTLEYLRESSSVPASSPCVAMSTFDYYKILSYMIISNHWSLSGHEALSREDLPPLLDEISVFRSSQVDAEAEGEHEDEETKSAVVVYHKSQLRLVYEWLKGLYVINMLRTAASPSHLSVTPSMSTASVAPPSSLATSAGSVYMRTTSGNASLLGPLGVLHQQQQRLLSPHLQPQHHPQQNQSPSPSNNPSSIQTPVNLSTASSAVPSASTSSMSSNPIIMRKRFNYKTRYNLIHLIKELESSLKDTCKCEAINTAYYSFKSQSTDCQPDKKRSLEPSDSVFLDTVATAASEQAESAGDATLENKSLEADEQTLDEKESSSDQVKLQDILDKEFAGAKAVNEFQVDCEFGADFGELKAASFANLHKNLNNSENLIVTMNVEYAAGTGGPAASQVQPGASNFLRQPSSFGVGANKTAPMNVAASSSSQAPPGQSNLMTKSSHSNISDLESTANVSSSTFVLASQTSQQQQQLKRTFLMALVHSKTKFITIYCFTTGEANNYEAVKQLIEQLCDQIIQRYYLVNNTVLFKYGGLIGDQPIFDFKKVKTMTLSSAAADLNQLPHGQQGGASLTPSMSLTVPGLSSSSDLGSSISSMSSQTLDSQTSVEQADSSPHRQWTSTKLTLNHSPVGQTLPGTQTASQAATAGTNASPHINSSIVANLHFSGTNAAGNVPPTSAAAVTTPSPSSPLLYQQQQSISSNQQLIIKQLYLILSNTRVYDAVNNIINHQIYFCNQYLTSFSNMAIVQQQPPGELVSSPSSSSLVNSVSLGPRASQQYMNPHLSYIYLNHRSSVSSSQSIYSSPISAGGSMPTTSSSQFSLGSSTFYGVGLGYHLYEMHQIYRHPKKIYELASNLANVQHQHQQQAQSAPTNASTRFPSAQLTKSYSSGASVASSNPVPFSGAGATLGPSQSIMNVNEFYKNSILPVLVPFHYCCTPLLFYPNWHEKVVSESMLRNKSANLSRALRPNNFEEGLTNNSASRSNLNNIQQQSSKSTSIAAAQKPSVINKPGAAPQSPLAGNQPPQTSNQSSQFSQSVSHDQWYQRMRQMFLIEYSKYFESKGFVRLKDVERHPAAQTSGLAKAADPAGAAAKPASSAAASAAVMSENLHFIKWIQQDGFIYLTIHLEEIYLHAKLGYCTRYRTNIPRTFLNEVIRFFSQEFHVYSFTYDYHLSVINQNLTSASWVARTQISQIISKFLDEFVEFYSRLPLYSTNKVYKIVNEKPDSWFIHQQQQQQQIGPKFGLIFDYMSGKNKNWSSTSQVLMPLFIDIKDNNIAIYSLTDSNTNATAQQTSASAANPSEYSKFFVIKIENYVANEPSTENLATPTSLFSFQTPNQTPTPSSRRSMAASVVLPSTSTLNPKALPKGTLYGGSAVGSSSDIAGLNAASIVSNSSSSSSLVSQTNPPNFFSDLGLGGNPAIRNAQQQQFQKTPSYSKQLSLPKKQPESFIRVITYCLFINKSQQSVATACTMCSLNNSGFSSIALTEKFSQDLKGINKLVDDAIQYYKQEIFWENLTLSTQPLLSLVSESTTGPVPTTMPMKINTTELEQIISDSHVVNALELDAQLGGFFKQLYAVQDNIRHYLQFKFGRHLLTSETPTSSSPQFASSDYCLLLVTDEFIKNFKHSVSLSTTKTKNAKSEMKKNESSLSLSSRPEEETSSKLTGSVRQAKPGSNELKSFVLIKFDNANKNVELYQVNRKHQQPSSNHSSQLTLGAAPTSIASKSTHPSEQASSSFSSKNSILTAAAAAKTDHPHKQASSDSPDSTESSSTWVTELASSVKGDSFMPNLIAAAASTSDSTKYLTFTINILMYVLWDSLFCSMKSAQYPAK